MAARMRALRHDVRNGARRRISKSFFGYVHPKWRTPAMNIITVGAIGAAGD